MGSVERPRTKKKTRARTMPGKGPTRDKGRGRAHANGRGRPQDERETFKESPRMGKTQGRSSGAPGPAGRDATPRELVVCGGRREARARERVGQRHRAGDCPGRLRGIY